MDVPGKTLPPPVEGGIVSHMGMGDRWMFQLILSHPLEGSIIWGWDFKCMIIVKIHTIPVDIESKVCTKKVTQHV